MSSVTTTLRKDSAVLIACGDVPCATSRYSVSSAAVSGCRSARLPKSARNASRQPEASDASPAQLPASAVSRALELVTALPTATATLKYALRWSDEMRLSRPRNDACVLSSGTAASAGVISVTTLSSPLPTSKSRTVFRY